MKTKVLRSVSLLGLVVLFAAGAVRVSAGAGGGGCTTCGPERAAAPPTVTLPEQGAGASLVTWLEAVGLVITFI
jgi:hypothetical protein